MGPNRLSKTHFTDRKTEVEREEVFPKDTQRVGDRIRV